MWTGCAPTGSMTAPCTTACRSSPTSTTSRAWPMGSGWICSISWSVGECDADPVASTAGGGDIDLPPAPGRPCRAWVPPNRRRVMHAVFRRYRIRLGAVEAAAERAHDGLVPGLRRVPGVAAYYLLHAGNDTLASIAPFHTQGSAAGGERLLNDWFRHHWPRFHAGPPPPPPRA